MNAAKVVALSAIRADRFLAQFFRAQRDTFRAEAEFALRALQESVPLFNAVRFLGTHSGDSEVDATSLVELDKICCSLLWAGVQLRKATAERFTRSTTLWFRRLICVWAAGKELGRILR